jgi:uridine phosphorylase
MRKKPYVDGDPSTQVTLTAATAIEYKALRRALPGARVVQTGVGLERVKGSLGDVVVSCGLAGGLRTDLPTGTVLIPRTVRRPGGSTLECDPMLVEALAESAHRLGIAPIFDALVTSDTMLVGAARASWAAKGYAGVDMETGLISAPRVAAVRVVLDTPENEIASDWVSPLRAIMKPWNWHQAIWLAREAPRAAALAASVVAAAQGLGTF